MTFCLIIKYQIFLSISKSLMLMSQGGLHSPVISIESNVQIYLVCSNITCERELLLTYSVVHFLNLKL